MDRCPGTEQLQRLLAEQLPGPERAPVEEHVDTCPLCQALLERLAAAGEDADRHSGTDVATDPGCSPDTDFVRRLKQTPPWAPASLSESSHLAGREADPAPGQPTVAGYEVLGELGRGGMGVVYKARQRRLDRLVALKMILAGGHAGAEDLARFRTEAEAAARLQHPNIVQIYEVGEHDGLPFLALEYVDGHSLARQFGGTPQPARAAAQLVATLARAMHAAHLRGIVHRDLKPANILLKKAEGGRMKDESNAFISSDSSFILPPSAFVPKITDFGLAKKLDSEGQTRTGAVMGTPSYMAPEQAAGEGHTVGPAADVYALGAILYELLTGRPPFKGPTPLETIRQVLEEEALPPSRLQSRIPRDLETICLKCLHKEPGQRYASAAELADDLERYLAGEPIRARPVTRAERLVKWVKRHPALAGVYTLLVLVLVLGLGGGGAVWLWQQAESARQDADSSRKEAEIQKGEAEAARGDAENEKTRAEAAHQLARRISYDGAMLNAGRDWDEDNIAAMRLRLEPFLEAWDLHSFEWHYNRRLLREAEPFSLKGHTGAAASVAFSPAGQRIVVAGGLTLKLWDLETGQNVRTFKGHNSNVTSVAFSPDGQRIVSGCSDVTLKVWDPATGQEIRTLKGRTGPVTCVAISPDGKWIVSGSLDKTLTVWDLSSGQEVRTLNGHTWPVWAVAVSPDGQRIVSGSGDQTLKVWDLGTGQEIRTLKGHIGAVRAVAFTPSGRRIISGDSVGVLKEWDLGSGQEIRTFQGHTQAVWTVAVSPDGKGIVSGSGDQTLKVWDLGTGQEVRTLKGHTDQVGTVAVSPNGKQIVSGSWDQTVKVWDLGPDQEDLTLKGHIDQVRSVVVSPDGQRIISGSQDRTVKVWEVHTGEEVRTFKGHTGAVFSVAVSPDGKRIVSGSQDRTVKVWDLGTGQEVRTLEGHSDLVKSVAVCPDGRRIVSGSVDQTVKVWDLETGQEVRTFKVHFSDRVTSVTWSPNGQRIVWGSLDRTVKVWDLGTGQEVRTLRGHTNEVHSVAFSADGQRIASGSLDRTVKLWDLGTGQEVLTFKGHTGAVYSVAFSPDGKRIASGCQDGTVKVWDLGTGQEILTLKRKTGMIYSVAFSPDGKRLVSGGRALKVWEGEISADDRQQRYQVWQQRQAQEYERIQDWFAAAFHLAALVDREPENSGLKTRWDRAVAQLAKTDPALAARVASQRRKTGR
jgi:WD40 repeat protein